MPPFVPNVFSISSDLFQGAVVTSISTCGAGDCGGKLDVLCWLLRWDLFTNNGCSVLRSSVFLSILSLISLGAPCFSSCRFFPKVRIDETHTHLFVFPLRFRWRWRFPRRWWRRLFRRRCVAWSETRHACSYFHCVLIFLPYDPPVIFRCVYNSRGFIQRKYKWST